MTLQLEPRIRETWTGTGTGTMTLGGAMHGSLKFSEAGSDGDTFDYVISYDTEFEEGTGTLGGGGTTLSRDTVSRARHSNNTVDQTKVSFPSGTKVVIATFRSDRAKKTVRYGESQSLSSGEKAQVRSNVGLFAAGTSMLFFQASAPTGWTKSTSHDNKAFRLVSGTGGGSGGSVDFSTLFGRTETDSHTLIQSELPSASLNVNINEGAGHAHGVTQNANSQNTGAIVTAGGVGIPAPVAASISVQSNFTNITADADLGGSGDSFTMPIDMRVRYVDIINATKD